MSLNKPISQIEEADLIELKDKGEREATTIDYKKEINVSTEEKKMEFRADAASFANASGGHIIFGIAETKGVPSHICGLDVDNIDHVISQLDSLLNTQIQPRLPRVQHKVVDLANGKPCLIFRIPKSLSQPHGVIISDKYRQFSTRSLVGKIHLDVPQIREAFLLSDAVSERIRQFRIERVGQIISENTPVIMDDSPKLIYHFVPLNAFSTTISYTSIELVEALYKVANGSDDYGNSGYASVGFGLSSRNNFDGILQSASGDKGGTIEGYRANDRYAQFYNSGIIEAVVCFSYMLNIHSDKPEEKLVNGFEFDREANTPLPNLLKVMETLGIEPPIFLMMSLVGVDGYRINVRRTEYAQHSIDRDILLFPEVLIEDYTTPSEIIVKDVLDRFWQAGGYLNSGSYNTDGTWNDRIRY